MKTAKTSTKRPSKALDERVTSANRLRFKFQYRHEAIDLDEATATLEIAIET